LPSPDLADEGDLDLRALRRTPARTTPARRGWRSYLIGGVVSTVLALFIAVVWFAYQDLMPGGDAAPPLIRAEAGPLKREPGERGGLPVVNAESAVVRALDEPDAPVRVERIVPRQSTAPRSTADLVPEALEAEPAPVELAPVEPAPVEPAPIEPVLAESATPGAIDRGEAEMAANEAASADSLEVLIAEIAGGVEELRAIEPAAGPADRPAAPATPPRVIVFDPQPPETAGDAATAAPPAAVSAGAPVVQSPDPALPAVRLLARADGSAAPAQPGGPADSVTATTAAATPPMPTASSPALAADFSDAFRVQLLAVRDEAAAAGAWASLQERYPGVLGALRSRVQRADLGESTFFRLQAGPFVDRADAASVCSALQARGADCFVVEPTS